MKGFEEHNELLLKDLGEKNKGNKNTSNPSWNESESDVLKKTGWKRKNFPNKYFDQEKHYYSSTLLQNSSCRIIFAEEILEVTVRVSDQIIFWSISLRFQNDIQ